MNRGSVLARTSAGGGWRRPLLADAVLYVDASRNGGDGSNDGTAGSALDAVVAYMPGTEKAAVYGGQDAGASTTPDAAGLDLTGDFCIAVDMHLLWEPPIPCELVAKPLVDADDVDDCYAFGVGTGGDPFIEFTRDGETVHEAYSFIIDNGADVTVDFSGDTDRKQLILEFDADNGAGGWTAKLYSGTPGASPTLLSSIVNTTDGAVTIETSAAALMVGKPVNGAIYRARVYSGRLASPTLVAELYPERDHVSGLTVTAGGTTSEVWSNVGTVETEAFAAGSIATNAALDLPAATDATLAFWVTTPFLADDDGETFQYAERASGTLGGGGTGWRLWDARVDGFGLDGVGLLASDGENLALVAGNDEWTAGTHLLVITIDRAADLAKTYVDGVETSSTDIAALGAMSPTAPLVFGGCALHAVAKWDEIIDPADIAVALGV